MAIGTVDRIRITTVVDNYIDNLRQDSAVARRYTAFVAGKMPDLRAEHGLAHFVETTRGGERFTMALAARQMSVSGITGRETPQRVPS